MVFNVTIINHAVPAISVIVADGGNGVGGVTYKELKQSLGNQVYDVGCLYLNTDNTSQLNGTINYNLYDVNGNANITNIATLTDPYQTVNALLVKIKDKVNTPIIFNGNSSISTTILPNTYVQVKFLADRITNKIGLINSNFTQMQEITNTKFFDSTYSQAGDAINCAGRENLLTSQSVKKNVIVENPKQNAFGIPTNILNSNIKKESDYSLLLLIASISAGVYIFSKE
jgi:hypothetical protein